MNLEQSRQEIDLICRTTFGHVAYLYERWLDEHEYEEIDLYRENIQKVFKDKKMPFLVMGMTKRPFGFKVRTENGLFHIAMRAKGKTKLVMSAKRLGG